jgi:hypothetical protein
LAEAEIAAGLLLEMKEEEVLDFIDKTEPVWYNKYIQTMNRGV